MPDYTDTRCSLFFPVGVNQAVENALPQGLFMQIMIFIQPLAYRQLQCKFTCQSLFQTGNIPLLVKAAWGNKFTDHVADDIFPNRIDNLGNIIDIHEFITLLVDDLALVICDVVKLEEVLADVIVMHFNLALGVLYSL